MTSIHHTHLASTHSTNSQLIDWITLSYQEQSPPKHNRPHFSRPHLLTSDTQTSGRGQHGRTWHSPIGNVYLSLYIPTREFASDNNTSCLTQRLDGRLSLCVGYQLSQMPIIQQINQTRQNQNLPTIGVKWVNDVGFYTNQQFQKLAGILIEPVTVTGNMLGVVVGVGINIGFAPTLTAQIQEGLNYQAVSLQELIEQALTAKDFYPLIQAAIVQAIAQFNDFNNANNVIQFIQDFSHVDVLMGKTLQITMSVADQTPIIGKSCGIDSNGSLQLQQDDSTVVSVWTGSVHVMA